MKGTVAAIALLGQVACGTAAVADPCAMSVEANVNHLVAVVADEDAWNEWLIGLFDNCPGKHLLVRQRLLEFAD